MSGAICVLCGSAPSAVRAATTAALVLSLRALNRRPSSHTVSAFAVIVLSALAPTRVLEPGFLLSVLATAAVLDASGEDPLAPGTRPGLLRLGFKVGLATTLTTAPIILWYFGSLPLAGILGNLVAVPYLALVLMPLCLLHVALALCWLPIAAPSSGLLTQAGDALLSFAALSSKILPPLSLPPLSIVEGVAVACLALIFLIRRDLAPRARRTLWALSAMGLVAGELWLRFPQDNGGQLEVHVLDVGQGDAILVRLPTGEHVLVDAGGDPHGFRDPGKEAILPLLAALRVERLDLVILSHPHPDHYGGLRAIMEQVPIVELWDSGQAELEQDLSHSSAEVSQLLEVARSKGIKVTPARVLCEGARRVGSVDLEVLWPCPDVDVGFGENNNSLTVLLTFQQRRFLFAGDIEKETEARLTEQGRVPRVDVLKVPHHGSRTSSTAPLLAAARAPVAIISAGPGNRFDHPHAEVTQRLLAAGTTVFTTRDDGSVRVRSDGRSLSIETWSGLRWRLPEETSVTQPH